MTKAEAAPLRLEWDHVRFEAMNCGRWFAISQTTPVGDNSEFLADISANDFDGNEKCSRAQLRDILDFMDSLNQ
jgi:hypothetical protein